ncbi:DNA glycosylase [Apiospora aurea]|uniref:DNA-(apurinic or apyrimidinic site) lyase n=1 Tax=Apiospora aurea TaxID=335848 RepID=A0ABR1QC49_9PEZI
MRGRMAIGRVSEWRRLPLSLTELCLDTTLRCGQSFRWRKIEDEWSTWPAEVKGNKVTEPHSPHDDTEQLLQHYFSLKHNAAELYELWSLNDLNFRKKAPKFTGIRIMSQDAWETLVHKLCKYYGPLIGHVGEEPFHDFPGPQALVGKGVESHLRELGFGYRAKYIAETARLVSEEKPRGWLESLTNPENPGFGADEDPALGRATYKEAHEQLLTLSGVGPKVADCVCLMGLGWGEAVPVDTHVWQIAQRDYKFGKVKTKTFSKAMYDSVGDHFRKIWGDQAGWAQSVLFTANLKSFSDRSVVKAEVEDVKVKMEDAVTGTPDVLAAPKPRPSRKRQVTAVETVKVEEVDTTSGTITRSKRRRLQST